MTSRADPSSFFSFPSTEFLFSVGGCFFDHDPSIHPTLSFPREFPRWVCHVSTCFVSECPTPFYGGGGVGGIFRFTNLDDPRESFLPSEGRTKKKKIYPLDFPRDSISRNAIAGRHQERVEDEGGERRPTRRDRARARRAFHDVSWSGCECDRPAQPRARSSSSSSSSRRARGPPFLDALARTSWCVRTERGRSRAREGVDASRPSMCGVGSGRARGARGDDARERCGE